MHISATLSMHGLWNRAVITMALREVDDECSSSLAFHEDLSYHAGSAQKSKDPQHQNQTSNLWQTAQYFKPNLSLVNAHNKERGS